MTAAKQLGTGDVIQEAIEEARPHFAEITRDKINPHFKSKYASLDSIMRAIRPALAEQGLGVRHVVTTKNGEPFLETVVTLHGYAASSLVSTFPLPMGVDPQKMGSAIKYGRRYNVTALFDLLTEEDDDGNAASGRNAGGDRNAGNVDSGRSGGSGDDPARWFFGHLTKEFGDGKPWEDPAKKRMMEVIFGHKGVKKIKDAEPAEVAAALKNPETGWSAALRIVRDEMARAGDDAGASDSEVF